MQVRMSYEGNLSGFVLFVIGPCDRAQLWKEILRIVMEDSRMRGNVEELNFASRRAEEAALRRYQAIHWLDYLVGPLGIPSQTTEEQFISCLRNGLILCNVINKIQPGSVPKVIEKTSASPALLWDSQPLPAYQYFENVRNFLVAVQELKLPNFEASVFERENVQEGSSTKVVDCILALKDYYEWKQMTGGNGYYKPPRSPHVVHSAGRVNARAPEFVSCDSARRLDMSKCVSKPMPSEIDLKKLEDKIVKALAQHMADTKENMDGNQVAAYHSGNADSLNTFSKILSTCLEEQFRATFPEMKSSILDYLKQRSCSTVHPTSRPIEDLSNLKNGKCCRACLRKGNCNHWSLVEQQEKELSNIKLLLSSAKQEVESLRLQIQKDFKELGEQVIEMSNAALGYHNAVKENRNLYNMVQDLKGNIRVYCRIRPAHDSKVQNVIDFIGNDGSLVVVDPKPIKDGKKIFQFNHVFDPSASQAEVFRDTQPVVRSVLDGYNVCIFAYGQTGSGKTHTMYGPPGGSTEQVGISYLALTDLFELSDQRKGITKYEIQVQMVEIYNEQIHDLLAKDSGSKKYPFLHLDILYLNLVYHLVLPDATLCPVKSANDVIKLMKLGEVNRAVGSTAINVRSSRSHSVLSVHVHGEDASGSFIHSCLHLVDLAGSERVDKSEVTGDGLREAQHINKSLSCLVDVITALAQKNSHIPYRNSKLTLLLQNSLGGSAKTLMFAHVSPEGDSFGETMSTLKFAQRVSTVELGAARANKESSEVLELKAEIENLKKALADRDIVTPPTKRFKEAAKTPPKSRRLSIEKVTPPKSTRRLSIEYGAKTPSVFPPRPNRRLSIESGGPEQETSRPAKARSRRLSLEGPNLEGLQKNPCHLGHRGARSPLSPLSSSVIKTPVKKVDTARMKISTPEPQLKPGNGCNISSEMQTPCLTHKKGSQLKKSLRTIGKLINGSEKRNQQKPTEITLPGGSVGPKSPISTNARAVRRQSLTGVQQPTSRRSSLGGVSTDSYDNGNRNAGTTPPPQVRASTKLTKRWI
ncbi:P-loop nucleoside triphosphate hydrolases superfamily protein with CH (Calponin Homology) domain [Striga hermonthica]|uniref:P-loop nucleoside triphosphate hydrolases superfamily protein with CH (Calponin Homology) domain n=1 Tax=Striga hermonthica TaxID=68872 RepID=A0A9N7MRY9_STRHE|nr:P-loop nucleoside triphosphate hydrolases superfamily protein with CH (Calponin Homology) domain [Striga hermonthica]